MRIEIDIPDITNDSDAAAFCLWLRSAIEAEGEHTVEGVQFVPDHAPRMLRFGGGGGIGRGAGSTSGGAGGAGGSIGYGRGITFHGGGAAQ